MEAQELRIGNLVNTPFGTGEVLKIDVTQKIPLITCGCIPYESGLLEEQLTPMPLTPDILEKCGFGEYKEIKNNIHANHGAAYYIDHYDIRYILCRMWHDTAKYSLHIEYTDSPFPEDEGVHRSVCFDIEYLHQLQNLIFSITHSELKIAI